MRQSEVPREIWINDECWTIKFVRRLKLGKTKCLGLTDPSTRTIFILQGLSAIERAEIFCHEVTHAICFEYNFDLKHAHIYKLGEAMSKIWIDNF